MKHLLLIFASLMSLIVQGQSNNGSYATSKFKQLNQLGSDSLFLYDGVLQSIPPASNWKGDYCFLNAIGKVSISVDQDSARCLPDSFKFDIVVKVRRFTTNNQLLTESINLSIDYNKRNGNTFVEQNGKLYSDVHYLSAKVESVSDSALLSFINLNLELSNERTICLVPLHTESTPLINSVYLQNAQIVLELASEFQSGQRIYDQYIYEADEFDIEWTTVDLNDYERFSETTTQVRYKYDFQNNATRVTIGKNERTFSIKNIFEENVVVMFRYRRVNYITAADGTKHRITSKWSSDYSTTTPNYIDNPDDGEIVGTKGISSGFISTVTYTTAKEKNAFVVLQGTINAHLPKFNWQYQAVYAEGGRSNESIVYYDGSLRLRQKLTTNNSDNTVLFEDIFYDFIGRNAIQVLPVPVVSASFQYQTGLNKNMSGLAYSAKDFDLLLNDSSCVPKVSAMSTSSGASNYYSVANTNQNSFTKFTPIAGGYPFTQTTYMPDNTGRVRAKSGVGQKHQILPNGKYTEYAYEVPSQTELTRLFGAEVGYAEHYKKSTVIDPNGQASVSYTDLSGKTIATALAATPNQGMLPLASYNVPVETETDLIQGYSVQLAGDMLILTKRINIIENEIRKFKYSVIPQKYFPPNCGVSACYNCIYDLEISINEVICGDQKLDANKNITGTQYLKRTIGGNLNQLSSTCSSDTIRYRTETDTLITRTEGYVNVALTKGMYDIKKVLKINQTAFKKYEEIFLQNSVCKTLNDFENQAYAEMDTSGCDLTCDECDEKFNSLTKEAFINVKKQEYANDSLQYTAADLLSWGQFYDASKIRCAELCGNQTECDVYLDILKMDVTPGGQYAQFIYDTAGNIVLPTVNDPGFVGINLLANQDQYSNQYSTNSWGIRYDYLPESLKVVINGEIKNVKDLTLTEFVQNWDRSWADELVKFHPEYCEYQACRNHQYNSNTPFENDLDTIETYIEAHNKGYVDIDDVRKLIYQNYLSFDDSLVFLHYMQVLDGNGTSVTLNINEVALLLAFEHPDSVKYSTARMAELRILFDSCEANKDLFWLTLKSIYKAKRDSLQWANDGCTGANNIVGIYGATLRIGLDAPNWSEDPASPSTSRPTYATVKGNLTQACEEQCESYKPIWEENLKNCGLNSTQMTEILNQLKLVCINGCDENTPFGSSSVSPINAKTATYISFEDVLKRYPLQSSSFASKRNIYNIAVCSDAQIPMPKAYTHDYFSTQSPYADTCACEDTTLVNCPCSGTTYSNNTQTANNIKMLMVDVPESQKCQNCIDCFEMATVFRQFYDRNKSFTGVYFDSVSDDQQSLTSYLNLYLGFNLTFDDYKKQAALCMGMQDVPDSNIFDDYIYWVYTPDSSYIEKNYLDTSIWKEECLCQKLLENHESAVGLFNGSPDGAIAFTSTLISFCQEYLAALNAAQTEYEKLMVKQRFLNRPQFQIQWDELPAELRCDPNSNGPTCEDCGCVVCPPCPTNCPPALTCEQTIHKFDSIFVAAIDPYFGPYYQTSMDLLDYLKAQEQSSMLDNLLNSLVADGLKIPSSLTTNEQKADWLWEFMAKCRASTCELFLEQAAIFEEQYVTSTEEFHTMSLYEFIIQNPEHELAINFRNSLNNLLNQPPYFAVFGEKEMALHFKMCTQGPCQIVTTHANELKQNIEPELTASGKNLIQYLRTDVEANYLQTLLDQVNSELIRFPYFKKLTAEQLLAEIEACTMCPDTNLRTSLFDSLFKELVVCNITPDSLYIKQGQPGYNPKIIMDTICYNRLYQPFNPSWNIATTSPTLLSTFFTNNKYSSALKYSVKHISYNQSYYHATVENNPYQLPVYLKIRTINNNTNRANIWDYYFAPPPAVFDFNRIRSIGLVEVLRLSASEVQIMVTLHYTDTTTMLAATQDAVMTLPSHLFYKDMLLNQSCRMNYSLCNKPILAFSVVVPEDPCITRLKIAAKFNAQLAYQHYTDSLLAGFRSAYIATCLNTQKLSERFLMKYNERQYHYTLYYYDRAGNLVRTVPPAGVVQLSKVVCDTIDARRLRGVLPTPATLPTSHQKVTQYAYNSLNQLLWQKTPDAGESRFFYDNVGRLVVSQNSKQVLTKRFSYTVYDDLGRIREVGEIQKTMNITDPNTFRSPTAFGSWIDYGSRTQITRTLYDGKYSFVTVDQTNLRGRVASSTFQMFDNTDQSKYDYAVHYSYDVQGNVKSLYREIKALEDIGQDFKQVDYDFDLVSGKVNQVTYQQDKADQYIHRYVYDRDNRLIKVLTGHNEQLLEMDAEYYYYLHGPLARTELGKYSVQGLDYAYTINGWLKGVNSETLTPNRDMGRDGNSSSTNSMVARDEFGFVLTYYNGDYEAVGGTTAQSFVASKGSSTLTSNAYGSPLYNGNISAMTTAIAKFMEGGGRPLAAAYKYDQLNRIREANYFNNFDSSTNSWQNTAALTQWHNRFTYDADGNIITQVRRSNNQGLNAAMDSLNYEYYAGKNRLSRVRDVVSSTAYNDDIDDQSNSFNYTYDSIGNLISDAAEEIASIEWNVYGKITRIRRTPTSKKPDLDFAYSPDGHRILKLVTPKIKGQFKVFTYYMRDAQGNILATYDRHLNKIIDYDSLTYSQVNAAIVSKTNETSFGDFIATLHGNNGAAYNAQMITSIKNNMLNNPAQIRQFLLTLNPLSAINGANPLVNYDNLIQNQLPTDSMVTYIMSRPDFQDILTTICECLNNAHTQEILPRLDYAIFGNESALFNYLFHLWRNDQTHYNELMDELGLGGVPYNTAATVISNRVQSQQQETLNAINRFYRTPTNELDCSESNLLISTLREMIERPGSRGLLSELLAQIPDIRAFLTNVNMNPNISCNQLSNFEIIESWNNNNPSGLWDALYAENGSDADWLDWAIQYHLASFLQFNGINQRAYITQYQQNHYLYDSTGNGMENYFTHIANTYGNVFYVEFYNQSKAYVDSFNLKEWSLYGSARLGIHNTNKVMAWQRVYGNDSNGTLTQPVVTRFVDASNPTTTFYEIVRGNKQYELTNHLGNVLVSISDKRAAICNGNNFIEYRAEVLTATDYSPFGAPLPGRTWQQAKPDAVVVNLKVGAITNIIGWTTIFCSNPTNCVSPEPAVTLSSLGGKLRMQTNKRYGQAYYSFATIPGRTYKVKYRLSGATFGLTQISVFAPIGKVELYSAVNLTPASINGRDQEISFTATEDITRFYLTRGWASAATTPTVETLFLDYLTISEDWGYRFGFNGMEKDDETYGTGNAYDFGARMYSSRLGRWLASDPKSARYPGYSPYHFGYNNPIVTVDPNGEENIVVVGGQPRELSPQSDRTNPNHGYGQNGQYRRHFLEAGLNEAIAMKENNTTNGERTKILVFNAGYTQEEINYYTQKAMDNGIDIQFYSNKESLVEYVNNKDGARSADLVTNFAYAGHGNGAGLWVGYGSDYSEIIVSDFNSEAFDGKAEANLWGCWNGDQSDGLSDDGPICSIADQFCSTLTIKTNATNGYVWWGQNSSGEYGVGIFKPKDDGQFITVTGPGSGTSSGGGSDYVAPPPIDESLEGN